MVRKFQQLRRKPWPPSQNRPVRLFLQISGKQHVHLPMVKAKCHRAIIEAGRRHTGRVDKFLIRVQNQSTDPAQTYKTITCSDPVISHTPLGDQLPDPPRRP